MKSFVQWLKDPQRNYQTGLEIFNKHKRSTDHDAFLITPNPSQLHKNILHNLMLKLFHILKTTGYFDSQKADVSTVTRNPRINKIVFKGQELPADPNSLSQKQVFASMPEGESPMNLRSNKNYVNQLLGLEFSQLSHDNKLIFNNSETDFLNKKAAFISNSDIDRHMRGVQAKMKAIDPNPKFDHVRKELMAELVVLDKSKSANWKTIDTWEKASDSIESLKQLGEETELQIITNKRIRANTVFIRRADTAIPKMPSNTENQKKRIQKKTQEVDKRKAELIELGHPFKS